jgi:hypothetical protein
MPNFSPGTPGSQSLLIFPWQGRCSFFLLVGESQPICTVYIFVSEQHWPFFPPVPGRSSHFLWFRSQPAGDLALKFFTHEEEGRKKNAAVRRRCVHVYIDHLLGFATCGLRNSRWGATSWRTENGSTVSSSANSCPRSGEEKKKAGAEKNSITLTPFADFSTDDGMRNSRQGDLLDGQENSSTVSSSAKFMPSERKEMVPFDIFAFLYFCPCLSIFFSPCCLEPPIPSLADVVCVCVCVCVCVAACTCPL